MFKVMATVDLSGCPEAVKAFAGIATVDQFPWDYDAVVAAIQDYDAYLASTSVLVDAQFLARAKRLKVIGSPSTGTDHLDRDAIQQKGIACFDISKELDLIRGFTATAELGFGLLLAVNREICAAKEAVCGGDWARERFTGFQLYGKTLGIVGLGRLGTISARIGQGFGMDVIAADIKDVEVPEGVRLVDHETLYRTSDVITVHIHLTQDTRNLIGRRAFALMKNTAVLINTSRGGLVDEEALLKALQDGKIAGAGLDVIDGEWLDVIQSHPLVKYMQNNENLVITPHIGGATHESIYGARIFMAKKVAKFLAELNASPAR